MTFGEMLGRLREAAGLTQAALADKAGLSLRTIQSWEQGRRAPVSPDFFKLVRALGTEADAFAGCEDGKPAVRPRGRPAQATPRRTTKRK
jgi:transcriptional regulator with XRE-family HTH domain